MKKLILCLALIALLTLTACNNNTNNSEILDNKENIEENVPVAPHTSTDFTEEAGYKINFYNSFKDINTDSVFLLNNTVAQVDFGLSDDAKGTLLVDPSASVYITEPDDATIIDDIKVSIQNGGDNIFVYWWIKDKVSYVYSTAVNIKNTETLKTLVNDISLEHTV